MKRLSVFTATLFFSVLLSAQGINLGKGFSKDKRGQEELKVAEQFFDDENFLQALPHYRSLEQQYGDNPYLKYKVGICLLYKSDETELALDYLKSVKEKNAKAADIDFYMARAFHLNEKYDEALASLDLYLKNKKATATLKDLTQRYIEYCNNAKELSAKPIDVKITNVGEPVNTESSEYVPVLNSDETTMLFTYVGEQSRGSLQRLPGEPDSLGFYFEDIHQSFKDSSGKWSDPVALDTTINSVGHDACIAISNDGQTLIVFKNSNEDLGDIYFSKLNGTRWGIPVRVEGDVNTNAWEGSATLTADEKTMYFASERDGGYGGRDIYVSQLQPDGKWGTARNLGPTINTPLDDDAPFIHPNGVTLIFSSQGHKSMGGYDIFRTDKNVGDTAWSEPENIGYPINTPGDDKYFVMSVDGKHGYYSSGKAGGKGQQDIYLAETNFDLKNANVVMVHGIVTLDDKPVEVTIQVGSNGQLIDAYTVKSNASTGKFLMNLQQDKMYDLTFLLEGYPKEMRKLDAMRSSLEGMMDKDFDIHFYSDKYKSTKFSREDSLRRADSLLLAMENEKKKNQLQQSQTVTTTTTTTVKIGGMNGDDYNAMLQKFGNARAEGLQFTVQIAAYHLPDNFNYKKLEPAGKVEKQEPGDGITRFIIGKVDNLNEAAALRNKIVGLGSTDAFVTCIYNGKRMLLKDVAAQNFFQK